MTRSDVTVGVLHPGSMGAAVASQLGRAGVRVLRVPTNRSQATVTGAKRAGLEAVGDLSVLLELSDIKQLYADAAVDGKQLVVLAQGGVSRLAVVFADKAGAFVFHLYRDSSRLYPGNTLAEEAAFAEQ
ncbi:hypothetical protein OG729_22945 [Streptomyces sp. NBC_00210]|uniref:hypothetical protein n=1 Tax=Streptomyces sp. NBC_00210 TaxID=2903636 RepID=UPI00324C5291